MSYFKSSIQQYDSDNGAKGLQRNSDGVARLMVGKNKPVIKQTNNRGLAFQRVSDGGSLQRVNKSASRQQYGNRGALQMNQRPHYPSHSKSPRFVEEEFTFTPTETNNRSLSLPRKSLPKGGRQWDQSNHQQGLRMVSTSSEEHNGRRRRAPYNSIQEYEEAQRNRTLSSSGLHTTSTSDSITPQKTLVLQGNQYSIQDTGRHRSAINRPNRAQRSRSLQVDRQPSHLQLVAAGTFPAGDFQSSPRTMSAERQIARIPPDRYGNQRYFEVQPHQLANQVQVYSPSQQQTQPK